MKSRFAEGIDGHGCSNGSAAGGGSGSGGGGRSCTERARDVQRPYHVARTEHACGSFSGGGKYGHAGGYDSAYDLIGKIRQQPQGGAVAQAPVYSQPPRTEHLETPGISVHSRQAGYDEFPPQFQQRAVIIQPIGVRFILDAVPVEFRPVKSLDGIGVGYRSLRFRLGEARESGELPPPAVRYRFPQFVAKIAEKQEGEGAANSSPMNSIGMGGASR